MSGNDNKLIELKLFSGKANESRASGRYVVVHCPAGRHTQEDVFCLTPQVMQWSQHVYLFDLHSCMNYWERQAQQLGIELFELYEKILLSVFGDDCTAVFCGHPWQGISFLNFLIDNKARGLYALNSLFNKKNYDKLPWKYWFAALADLGEQLEAINARHFNAAGFRAKTAQLQRFVRRLDLSGPCALGQAEVAAIRRRYSGWLGEAWGWTFQSLTSEGSRFGAAMSRFPWRPLKFQHSIRVQRHLEYPLSQWDAVEPLLQEDFSKLCRLPCWSAQDRISSLHWSITLFNMQQLEVDLSFRHPYSLHRDEPEFSTALYQAYYAYVDMMQALTRRDNDLDLPAEIPFISWQVEIRQRLHMPQLVLDMFAAEKPGAGYDSILDLQNCLPKAMEHYAIRPDFVPEQLFSSIAPGDDPDYGFSLKQWGDVVLPRPLFYYPEPLPMEALQQRGARFLERTAQNWWCNENTDDLVRDYFLIKNTQGQYLWVYRNSAGEWYQHGIYC